ncbi:hypothetical protein [Pandoraea faecigallinarum]|uniref:hypothetical protein n=1 Tax=Pandoraea faecigallinarum TaxID=656179 RepID=UPI00064BD44B|nr:hypothetical protein [Pandoraea faecigallinarum]
MELAHSARDLVCSTPAGLGTRTQDRLAAFVYNTIATVLGGRALLRDDKRAHPGDAAAQHPLGDRRRAWRQAERPGEHRAL